MQIPLIHTIQSADRKFETQTRPILIGCSDMNAYVCKYGTGVGFAQRLLCEYLGAQFMRLWNLPIPNYALIKVNPEHIPVNFAISPANFNQTCFGLQYNRNYAELTKMNELHISPAFKTISFKTTLLKIALFDCWMANEDRNCNNYNLMFDLDNDYQIVAIDHEGIFNSRVLDYPIYSLTYNDCLLNSAFAQKLFNKKDLTAATLEELESYFYLCLQNCEQNNNSILSYVPIDWKIEVGIVNGKIAEIFSDKWKKETFLTFQTFVQTLINTL